MLYFLSLLSAVSFLVYSIGCLVDARMTREFERYGLAKYRRMIGFLQLLAVVGLLVGYLAPMIGALAAGGLALQMLLAVGVRVKIGDDALHTFPALFYLLLNAWLIILYLNA